MSIKWGFNHSAKLNILLDFKGYYIGGSYIVKKHEANDVDVILHEHKLDDSIENNLRRAGIHRLEKGDKKYDEIDHERLMSVWAGQIDGTPVNIIVVGECYWPAYIASINEMAANPEYYQERDARVALHKEMCKQIKDMITGSRPEF